MTRATEAFEAYLDALDKEGIPYKLDETARNVLVSIDMHINKHKKKNQQTESIG